MANAYKVVVGDMIDYLSPEVTDDKDIRWRVVKVTSVTDQNNLVLAYVEEDGSRVAINGGVAVPRRTAATQTNVWRPY
jgi:hypothetical protein